MRVVALLLVLLAVVAAGCTSESGVLPGAPSNGARGGDEPSNGLGAAPEEKTFCATEDGCDFWDDDFHEYALYDVDTATVDVLIVPSASLDAAEDTPVIRRAIDAWATGIESLAKPWFRDAFTLNVYVLGTDDVPQTALDDPEIVVLAAEYNPVLLFGIGEQFPVGICRGGTSHAYPVHQHGDVLVRAARCEEGGLTCVALNTNFVTGTAQQLYDLVAHEVGHCLGGGHVGDALDFSAKRVPMHDIMSYQSDPEQVHCVSNLNVLTLEGLYAPVVGATPEVPIRAGQFLTMPRAMYEQVECA